MTDEAAPADTPAAPLQQGPYDGPVAFLSDGQHYPADDEGHGIRTQALRYDPATGGYRWAQPDDELHFATHHIDHVDLEFDGAESMVVTPEEADKVKQLLGELRKTEPVTAPEPEQ